MAVFSITVDTSEDDYKERVQSLINANAMKIAIDSYYSDIFRPYKHIELSDTAHQLLEELKDKFEAHFGDFKG